jgi:hypothetical protein
MHISLANQQVMMPPTAAGRKASSRQQNTHDITHFQDARTYDEVAFRRWSKRSMTRRPVGSTAPFEVVAARSHLVQRRRHVGGLPQRLRETYGPLREPFRLGNLVGRAEPLVKTSRCSRCSASAYMRRTRSRR